MFRWLALGAFVATLGISVVYRHRARRSGETIERRLEGARMMALRLLVAIPLYGGVLVYLFEPRWMSWSAFEAPGWLRWFGAALAVAAVPSAWWLFLSLGRNVSETVLTKSDHALVTTGPYRWIRHPLYTTGEMLFVGIGLMAANWFILLLSAVTILAVRFAVVPPEEEALVARFGDAYRDYIARTGRLLPRLGGKDGERERETHYALENRSLTRQIARSVETHEAGMGRRASAEELDEIDRL